MATDILNTPVKSFEGLPGLLVVEDGHESVRQLFPPLLVVLFDISGTRDGAESRDGKLLGALVRLEG